MTGPTSNPRLPQDGLPGVAGVGSRCVPPEEGLEAMLGNVLKRKVLIRNAEGFHMRPVTAFAELARRFQSAVTVTKDDQTVDGKSPLELLFLAATQGTELLVEASGPDAAEALAALGQLVDTFMGEDRSALPPKG